MTEKELLKRAVHELPEASQSKDQELRFDCSIHCDTLRDVSYPHDLGNIDGYEEIRVTFWFEKDPMEKDKKGWRHVQTLINKKRFVRPY